MENYYLYKIVAGVFVAGGTRGETGEHSYMNMPCCGCTLVWIHWHSDII